MYDNWTDGHHDLQQSTRPSVRSTTEGPPNDWEWAGQNPSQSRQHSLGRQPPVAITVEKRSQMFK